VELSCEDPSSQKDWVTNEVYFGALPDGGLLLQVPVKMGRMLVERGTETFNIIGQYLKPFELATGMNGRIYIKAPDGDYLRAVLLGNVMHQVNESTSLLELETICQEMEGRLRN
jgi:exosome complex RNA-binding protein Rrp4